MNSSYGFSNSILVSLGAALRLPNMSLLILDFGRTCYILIRSATLIMSGYVSKSSCMLQRGVVALLEQLVSLSLIPPDFGREEYFKYFPVTFSSVIVKS